MAVFILRALNYPSTYTPTGETGALFADVPSPNQPPSFELWIEDFYHAASRRDATTEPSLSI